MPISDYVSLIRTRDKNKHLFLVRIGNKEDYLMYLQEIEFP